MQTIDFTYFSCFFFLFIYTIVVYIYTTYDCERIWSITCSRIQFTTFDLSKSSLSTPEVL